MTSLLPQLIETAAARDPGAEALRYKDEAWTYGALWQAVDAFAAGLLAGGLRARERVAVYLPKQLETVAALFGAMRAGGTMVPVNPALKAAQVAYILQDCNVRVLVTSPDRLKALEDVLPDCTDLRHIVLVGGGAGAEAIGSAKIWDWADFGPGGEDSARPHRTIASDMASILYTSGSTGRPKGVVLSHTNMMTGAKSVAEYLGNVPEDRLLAVLPFSFDYGFSQLTTAFHVGASVTLMNHLFPADIPKMVAKDRITGLACVPPLWFQLAELDWPAAAAAPLRYITSTGGRMPDALVKTLAARLPGADIFLMYGLTEAFRSTYLPPDKIDERPNSIGKAIPNAEILVVRPDGTLCDPDEPGELVHRGPLVGMGYWNDPERTAARYKPAPGQDPALPLPEIAVWSGDTVKMDKDGYLYFVGRGDDMIKTSGFRVSPTEVEEAVFASGAVSEVAAIGIEDDALGQAVVIVATPPKGGTAIDEKRLLGHCRKELPSYMVPSRIVTWEALPRNPNGKVDRKAIRAALLEVEGKGP